MGKALYIAEKPSVAQEFAKALHVGGRRGDGYVESEDTIITWCVGHLVTMSYPEAYDIKYKRWSLETLPFLPDTFRYEVIGGVKKQFQTVKGLLTRKDVDTIYVCTDSGREGEYIYRLVEQMAGVRGKRRLRVWIDSQTEEEILKGIREAKDLSAYDNLAESAYLRAKEDYLMGINFSRLLTLRYGNVISGCMRSDRTVVSVGRVMTCVLGMVVRKEREIREFVKTPFYRLSASVSCEGKSFDAEWRAVEGSRYFGTPYLYKDNGFLEREKAEELAAYLMEEKPVTALLSSIEKKKEKKNPPLLFNLAELQNTCSRRFKLSPDETLKVVQELYEKKLVTYPRTDARVLSTAVAKEIHKNIRGLEGVAAVSEFASHILETGSYKGIAKTRYVNDKQITDHYAIIPTGQGIGNLKNLSGVSAKVYEAIARRFLSVFYPPAVYQKWNLELLIREEHFFAGFRVLLEEGYLAVAGYTSDGKKNARGNGEKEDGKNETEVKEKGEKENGEGAEADVSDPEFLEALQKLVKGRTLPVKAISVKEGETSPPKRYTSGTMILAMENAGQLIEDEELRAQIKGSGIGTSATRAEILKKLVNNKYLALNKKTQVITPTLLGEVIHDTVYMSIRPLLNPDLTASWEKGLTYVAEGTITGEEYMKKLEDFVSRRIDNVLRLNNSAQVRSCYGRVEGFYKNVKQEKRMRKSE
ncbi:MAG: type IA DNA topoisomerase [Lachnospiraceae bacterium]|nr:type IA DNA topoisomerase [Lachnospiraceae bacterium]